MSRSTIALVLFIVAVILAAIAAAYETPYYSRQMALAFAFASAGLAVEAA